MSKKQQQEVVDQQEAEKVDHRSEHMKREEAEAEAIAALPPGPRIVRLLEPIVAEFESSARHNSPIPPGAIRRLAEVLAVAKQL